MKAISTYSIRPKRIIYYIKPTKAQIDNFYNGEYPEELSKYNGAFGTYGKPGLFIINDEDITLKVLGIEFRPDDYRIEYPKGLDSILIPNTFFHSDEILDDADDTVNDRTIMDHIDEVCDTNSHKHKYINGHISVMKDPDVIQIFCSNGHTRVMISADFEAEDDSLIKEAGSKYEQLYFHDTITGYYNWNYLWPRMSAYNLYGIQDYIFAIFDIKDFKSLNVVYGHLVANDVLTSIGLELEKQDWIYCSARCDNDNFAMMIKDMSMDDLVEKLNIFFDSISILKHDPNYKMYFRCGISSMRNTIEMGNLVGDAAKQAKAHGTKPFKTEIIFFTDEMREEQETSIRLRNYLDTAIARDEFLVYIQPKYSVRTGKIKGGEALIRWNYKGKEMLSPGVFVPMFESGGLISKLDDIVLKKVCQKFKEWEKLGLPLLPISVNVSRKSVAIPGLVDHLNDIVDSFGVDHSLIDFELTESAAFDNQKHMINVLKAFKEKGYKLSMDDFGTGYSSLSLLSIMPFDTLKIDKSFVDGIGTDIDSIKNCAVIEHIIALAKKLNLTCLAEGAEDKIQVELLRDFGCEIVQGYYYSKPLPMEEYELLL